MAKELSADEVADLRRNFKRCREDTIEAIIKLRQTGDVELIPDIVRGIVWRYVQEEARPIVEEAKPETPLSSLGIDSLMMLEVVLDVQDALELTIEDADLRRMQTIGDVVSFLQTHYAQVHQPA